MGIVCPDSADYQFLTMRGSKMNVRLHRLCGQKPELEILGNREGMLSLANVLLWLLANSSRRELLSLGELSFVTLEDKLSVLLRLTDGSVPHWGALLLTDKDQQLEWRFGDQDLTKLALIVHHLVSCPWHEYDRLPLPETSYADVRLRLTDAERWL